MTSRVTTPDILGNMLTGEAKTERIELLRIKTNGGTQMRAGLNADTVTEYAESMKEQGWGDFPPVTVYYDGQTYWLADGFHRLAAYRMIGVAIQDTLIPAIVKAGDQRVAILHAAGANANHGLRRTNADKRRAVEVLLRDEEWRQWSNVEIAKRCAVDEKTVRTIRTEMYPPTSEFPKSDLRTGADGRTINTANIGTNRPTWLSEGDLTTIVQTWMAGFWRRPWPENPSHTNGTLWIELTTWMKENVKQPWQENDLKTAIKRLHYAHVEQWKTPAPTTQPAAAVSPDFAPVWQLEGAIRQTASKQWQLAGSDATLKRQIVAELHKAGNDKAGAFWVDVKDALIDTIKAYRHQDLQQAFHNVAEQLLKGLEREEALLAQTWTPPGTGARIFAREPAQPAPTTQPAAAPVSANIRAHIWGWLYKECGGDYRRMVELAERLHAQEAGHPQWFKMYPAGERHATVIRALEACIDEAAAQVPEFAGGPKPLEEDVQAAADAQLRQMQLEGVQDDLNLALDALTRFGDLTGKHTETLLAGRELRRLLTMLEGEMRGGEASQ